MKKLLRVAFIGRLVFRQADVTCKKKINVALKASKPDELNGIPVLIWKRLSRTSQAPQIYAFQCYSSDIR